jgi:hypothetical protein
MIDLPTTRDFWADTSSDDEPHSVESVPSPGVRQSDSSPSYGNAASSSSPSAVSAGSHELPGTPPPATTNEELANLYGWGRVEDTPTTPGEFLRRRNREIREGLQTNMQPSVAARKRMRKRNSGAAGGNIPAGNATGDSHSKRPK